MHDENGVTPPSKQFDLSGLLAEKREQTDLSSLISEAAKRVPVDFSHPEQASITSQSTNSTGTSASGGDPSLRFYGIEKKKPLREVEVERPYHRLFLYAAMSGMNATEIAEATGYHPTCIRNVLKQPWALEFMSKQLEKHGCGRVEQILRGASADAAALLVETIRDPECDIKVRSSNAKEVLDRVFGRSQQFINHRTVDPADLSDEQLAAEVVGTSGTATASVLAL